jgi:very-short-patch-repair endonuclease
MAYDPKNMTTQQFLQYHKNRMLKNPTKAELIFKQCLDRHGINYVAQKMKFKKGIKRIFDFWICFHKIIIEIDGGYHNPALDANRDLQIKELFPKYKIIRFTNQEVLDDVESCFQKVYSEFNPKYL